MNEDKKTSCQAQSQMARKNGILLLVSMILTFVSLRVFLHWAPETDLNIGRYNIHHLFSGLILITIGGIPLAVFRNSNWGMDMALITFGIGLGMALDEWVFLIATDGSNSSYLLPVSIWGGAIVIGLACAYLVMLMGYSKMRDRIKAQKAKDAA